MKKFILSLSCIVASIIGFAQPQNYVFTVTTGVPYQNLSTPTTLTMQGWDDFTADVPLGFMLHFLGDSTNTLYFYANDMNVGTDLQFHTSSMSATPYNAFSMIIDLEDRNTYNSTQFSKVGYQTDVVGGKKITKIEWNNAGLLDDSLHVDSLNAQLWIYENNNTIEYRIGNSSRKTITEIIKDPNLYGFKGPVFGLLKNVDLNAPSLDWMYYPSNLSPATTDSADFAAFFGNPASIGIDSFPKSNTVLRWAPAFSTAVNSVNLNDNISVFPTQITSDLHIRFTTNPNYVLSIYNTSGDFLFKKSLSKLNETIDMSNYASGNYILSFTNQQEKIVYQVSKR